LEEPKYCKPGNDTDITARKIPNLHAIFSKRGGKFHELIFITCQDL